jgi:hypothetical protein
MLPRMLETRPGDGRRSTRVLVDAHHEARLQADGVVVVPALDPDEIRMCLRLRRSLAATDDHGLTVDYMRPDRTVMRRIDEGTRLLWNDVLPRLFEGFRPVMTTFVVKHPGVESEMLLHEDRSYVDEELHRAFTVWIPLVDVNDRVGNGVLQVVPGSHRLPVGMAGSLTPDLIRPYERYLQDRLVPIEAAAGDAVIYDTRLLHASRANLTDAARPAIVCAVVPTGSTVLHVVATGRGGRRIHAVDARFFVERHPRDIEIQMPATCPVVREYHDDRRLEPEQVAAVLGSAEWPQREPVLPPDLHGGDPVVLEALEVRGQPLDGPDLRVRRVDGPATGCGMEVRAGRAWSRSIRRRRERSGPRVDAELRGLSTGDLHADLVVLEPGARVTLEPSRRILVRWELVVLESPGPGAGVRCGDGVANPGPGQRVAVPAGQGLMLWNDGPGEFAVALVGRFGRSAPRGR